jgi:hypothetical protein
MAHGKSVSGEPLEAADVLQRIELARRLLALAASQHHQSKLNLDLATVGLAELEVDLSQRGLRVVK